MPVPTRFSRSKAGSDYRLRGLEITGSSDALAPQEHRRRHESPLRRHRRRVTITWSLVLLVAAAAALLVRAWVMVPFSVPSATMAPAVQVGDRILVIKWSFLAGPIKRGEIIVVRRPQFYPCPTTGDAGDLVTRVVALPGQRIWSHGTKLFVNGTPLQEPGWYDPKFGQLGHIPVALTTVPPNEYYVMGDNRVDACDSRSFGPISKSLVVGKVVAILMRGDHAHLQFL